MTSLIIVEVYFGILLQNKNTTPGQPACQFALLPVSFFLFFPSHYVQNSEFWILSKNQCS